MVQDLMTLLCTCTTLNFVLLATHVPLATKVLLHAAVQVV